MKVFDFLFLKFSFFLFISLFIFFEMMKMKMFNKYNFKKTKFLFNSFLNTPTLAIFIFLLWFFFLNFLGLGWSLFFLKFSVFICLLSWTTMFFSLNIGFFWSFKFFCLKELINLVFELLTVFSRSISLTIRLCMNLFMGFILILIIHFFNDFFIFLGFFGVLTFFEILVIFLQVYIFSFLTDMYWFF